MSSTKVPSKPKRKGLLAVATMCVLLSGCTGSPENAPEVENQAGKERVFHVATEMDQLVKEAIEKFPEPLPSGVQWMEETPTHLKQSNTQYEAGMAEGAVTFYWLCAWEKSFLDAFEKGDQTGQDDSLAMVEKFQQTPWYKSSVEDPEQGWLRDVVTPAKLGDPSGIKREFEFGCSRYNLN